MATTVKRTSVVKSIPNSPHGRQEIGSIQNGVSMTQLGDASLKATKVVTPGLRMTKYTVSIPSVNESGTYVAQDVDDAWLLFCAQKGIVATEDSPAVITS